MEQKKQVGRPKKTVETNPGEVFEQAAASLRAMNAIDRNVEFFMKRTWLTSPNFLKRSFAILGYCMSAYLIVLLGIMIFVALFQAVFE